MADLKEIRKNLYAMTRVPPQEEEEGGGDSTLEWQSSLYQVYETIHDQHEGSKAPVKGFNDKKQTQDPGGLLNQDRHPLQEKAYFSGMDETEAVSVPGENTDPNVRAELRKRLEQRLRLQQNATPYQTPKPF